MRVSVFVCERKQLKPFRSILDEWTRPTWFDLNKKTCFVISCRKKKLCSLKGLMFTPRLAFAWFNLRSCQSH